MRRAVLILFVVASAYGGFALGLRTNGVPGGAQGPRLAEGGAGRLDSPKRQKAVDREERLGRALEAVFAIGDRSSPNRLGQYAALCAALENLSSAEVGELLDKLDRRPPSVREALMPLIVSWWAQRDADAVMAWLQPTMARLQKQRDFMGMSRADEALLDAWASGVPKAALDFVRENPDHAQAKVILDSAIERAPGSWADRFAVLKSLPDSAARRSVETRYVVTWALNDRPAALAAVSAIAPGKERDDALRYILVHWTQQDPVGALKAVLALRGPDTSSTGEGEGETARLGPNTSAGWVEGETADAMARTVSSLVAVQIKVAMEMHAKDTVKWLQSLPPGPERDRYSELALRGYRSLEDGHVMLIGVSDSSAVRIAASFATQLAAADPAGAQKWAAGLTGPSRNAAWMAFGRESAGQEWPEFPAGPDRDAFLSGLAEADSGEPQMSADAALQISDPALRRQAFDDAMSAWSESSKADPAKKRARLEQAAVPPDWKLKWVAPAEP